MQPGETQDDHLFGNWAAEASLHLLAVECELGEGQQIGPYRIERKIAEGGMGEVYRARDTRLDRVVALKLIDSAYSQDPVWQERFATEARTVANLSHPNICALYDVGQYECAPYLVMEFAEG